jgi:hypothetical protein
MRKGYAPFKHRTFVSHPLLLLSEVNGSRGRHPLTIPRHEAHRIRRLDEFLYGTNVRNENARFLCRLCALMG